MIPPLVAVQGLWVRHRVDLLPEASGPTSGATTGPRAAPLRLAVLGESTAAGCGAATHDEAFPGALARALGDHLGRPVRWTTHGRRGATIRFVRDRLLSEIGPDSDVAVLLIGVNDVLNRSPAEQWGDDLAAVVDALTERAECVVVAGIPPFEAFPSLPRALARYLAQRARLLDAVAERLCAPRPSACWIGSADLIPTDPALFADDGFHPSPDGYQRWADALSERITQRGRRLRQGRTA